MGNLNEFKAARESLEELIRKIKSTKSREKYVLASQAIYICEQNKWYDDSANISDMVGLSKDAERYRSLHLKSQRKPATFIVTNNGTEVYEEIDGQSCLIARRPPLENLD